MIDLETAMSAIEHVLDLGWKLAPSVSVNVSKQQCCALGALHIIQGRFSEYEIYNNPIVAVENYDGFFGLGFDRAYEGKSGLPRKEEWLQAYNDGLKVRQACEERGWI